MAEEVLSDPEIAKLIAISKILPINWQRIPAHSRGNLQATIDPYGMDGTLFRIIVRQNIQNSNNFSVILAVELAGKPQINLLRYDGGSHPHRNKIEGNQIMYKPHIHKATERYQRLRRADPEGYAEETNRYMNINGAWDCFRIDVNLQSLSGEDLSLPRPFVEG